MAQNDNIIQFPVAEKQWREIEASIRSAAAPFAPPKDALDHMLQKAKQVFLKHCSTPLKIDVSVPQDAIVIFNNTIGKVTQHFQNITTMLMVEIMTREIELYYCQLDKNKR